MTLVLQPKNTVPRRLPTHRSPQQAAAAARAAQQRDHQRGSAASRGYDARWRAYRKSFIARHPICNTRGCRRPTTDVDHIQAVSGPQDALFWDPTNHQGLCHTCHSRKTATSDGGFGHR